MTISEKDENNNNYTPDSLPEVFSLIGRIEKKLNKWQRNTIKSSNLTPAQLFILTFLAGEKKIALKDLAEACYCTKATITGIIDTMEKKGLVRRIPNPDDRRSLLAEITEAGMELSESTDTIESNCSDCCSLLTTEETVQLSRLLHKLDQELNF